MWHELISGWTVRRTVVSHSHQSSRPIHDIGAHTFWIYFRLSRDVCSVGGDILVNYEGVCGNFINLKMTCRFRLSEILKGK